MSNIITGKSRPRSIRTSRTPRKGIALVVTAITAWAAGSILCLVLMSQDQPVEAPVQVTGCPTEDSCTLDYSDGVWTIAKDVP